MLKHFTFSGFVGFFLQLWSKEFLCFKQKLLSQVGHFIIKRTGLLPSVHVSIKVPYHFAIH